jgi:hypothetical protein
MHLDNGQTDADVLPVATLEQNIVFSCEHSSTESQHPDNELHNIGSQQRIKQSSRADLIAIPIPLNNIKPPDNVQSASSFRRSKRSPSAADSTCTVTNSTIQSVSVNKSKSLQHTARLKHATAFTFDSTANTNTLHPPSRAHTLSLRSILLTHTSLHKHNDTIKLAPTIAVSARLPNPAAELHLDYKQGHADLFSLAEIRGW